MLCRAYVQDYNKKKNLVTLINIPAIQNGTDSLAYMPDLKIGDTIIATPAGVIQNLQKGDCVIVGFENDDLSKPIILGILQSSIDTNDLTLSTIFGEDLEIFIKTKLPENTAIGEVGPNNLIQLKGLDENVKTKFGYYDQISTEFTDLSDKLNAFFSAVQIVLSEM